jgi:hypothetical protein
MTFVLDEPVVEELRSELRGRLIGPADPDYETARKVHNGMIDKRPAVIARCAGVADVMAALQFASPRPTDRRPRRRAQRRRQGGLRRQDRHRPVADEGHAR